MRLLDLFRSHFLDHFLLADRGIWVAADSREDIPHVSPDEIRRRHAQPDLIIPADARLRAGMALHGRAEIPLESAGVVLLDPEPKCIHNANQLFGVRVARPRCRPERGSGLGKSPGLHQIARCFDFRPPWKRSKRIKNNAINHFLQVFFLLLAAPALGAEFPLPITADDFIRFDARQAAIGQLLFYDKILSGNRNISCGTCHHHDFAGTDGLSLGIGEGGVGVGPKRSAGSGADRIVKRIPRNAPGLWNLGHKDIRVLFHDGRLERSDIYGNGFNSPAEEWLPEGLSSILAAQAIFPLTAQFEMAGNPKENEVAGAVHDRIDAAWPILAKRVRTNPEYGAMFIEAFDQIDTPEEVTITEIANAIGAFIGREWQSFDSPFDRWLGGDAAALSTAELRGASAFYGKAGCATCHSGPLLTDQAFHALALPAIGPGRTRRFDPIARDVGRMGESDALEDAYRFRTPSLRNVALTAPYGHNGAYPTLEGILRHHLDPLGARASWSAELAALPKIPWLAGTDFLIQADAREMARQERAVDIRPVALSEAEIADLLAFLGALTGDSALERPLGRPKRVPSGLPVD